MTGEGYENDEKNDVRSPYRYVNLGSVCRLFIKKQLLAGGRCRNAVYTQRRTVGAKAQPRELAGSKRPIRRDAAGKWQYRKRSRILFTDSNSW
jgi:hypothetical protein